MNVLSRWVFALILLLPVFAVAALAVPRLVSGAAQEGTFLAGLQIIADAPLSPMLYRQTAEILSEAPAHDGETQLVRAEAMSDAGLPAIVIIPIVESALSRSPGSARGWIVLAALLRDRDPKSAARDLTLSFKLAPMDYYLILPRLFAGASLWDYLPGDVRAGLVQDARRLAMDQDRRGDLRTLLTKRGGPALVTRALAGQPEMLRSLNRELVAGSLHL
jgi:hypothetical protein